MKRKKRTPEERERSARVLDMLRERIDYHEARIRATNPDYVPETLEQRLEYHRRRAAEA